MDYVGSTFGQSTKASLMEGELMVTEVDMKLLPKFVTEEAMKNHITELKYWEKELYQQTKKDFQEFSWNIRRDLSIVYGILYSLYHTSLHDWLEIDTEYQKMVSKKRYNTMILYRLIRKIYNRSTSVVSKDILGNLVESLYNLLMTRGEDYESFIEYFEMLKHRYNILKELGFGLAMESLRDTCMTKLLSCGQSKSQLYR